MTGYSQKVADEVAARYGVAVKPCAVQVVPQGTSGIPLPVWDGHKLIIPDWKEKRQRMAVNRAREARRAGAASDTRTVDLRDQIAALYAQGMTDGEMAAVLGKSAAVIAQHRRFLRLAPIRRYVPPPENPAQIRRRRVRELHDLGRDRVQIAALLGVNARVLSADAKALGIALALPAKVAVPRRQPGAQPQRRARRGDSNAASRERANAVRMAAAAVKRDEVLGLLASGLGFHEVAAQTGFTPRHVRHLDRKNRLASGMPTLRVEALRADVSRLAAQGLSRTDIVAELQRSRRSVNRHLAELGYQFGDLPGDAAVAEVSARHREIEGRLRAMLARGMTRADMAADMGMARKRLSIWLARIGIGQGDVSGDDRARGSGAQKLAQHDALRAHVADMVRSGMALAEIAAAVGRPAHSVRMLAHFAGVCLAEESEVGAATARRALIVQMAGQGKSRQDIMEALGIDRHRLAYDLRIMKLDLPRIKAGPAAQVAAPKVAKPRNGRKSPEKAKRLQRIRDMAAKGKARDEMVKSLGCSYERLSAYLKEAGVTVPRLCESRATPAVRSAAAEARRDMVVTLRNQGASLLMICTELGLPRSTVCADLTALRRQGRLVVAGRVQDSKVRRAMDHVAEICDLARQGMTAGQIARRLAFSPGAVAAVLATQSDQQEAA